MIKFAYSLTTKNPSNRYTELAEQERAALLLTAVSAQPARIYAIVAYELMGLITEFLREDTPNGTTSE